MKFNLVDKPNARKVHQKPVPLIGGIMVFISAIAAASFSINILEHFQHITILVGGAFVLLIVGVIDDKIDMRATHKLIIQIALAYGVYASGIKIESLHGILGIHELPEYGKFLMTIIVITGTVNAFNLTDGIDGLAAGLAIIGLGAFSIIAFILNQTALVLLYMAIMAALLGFLKFNLSKENKVFLGDAGSLFLGFILVVTGIDLIQIAGESNNSGITLFTVIGVLIIPVIDSLRVFRKRIKRGQSPFKADKTHLHHLLLNLEIKHLTATIIIVIGAFSFLIFALVTGSFLSLTVTMIIILQLFAIFTNVLTLNTEVNTWREKIRELERF